jgi:hypothetical protein
VAGGAPVWFHPWKRRLEIVGWVDQLVGHSGCCLVLCLAMFLRCFAFLEMSHC